MPNINKPPAAAFAAHAMGYDENTLDKDLVHFLQRFYTYSDDRQNGDSWAAHFAEDAVMKKATTDVKGRKAIAEVNEGSWKGQQSRQHIVHSVFPYSATKTDKVMIHGMSKYVFEDQSTGEMAWAARICLQRPTDSEIFISLYQIFPTVMVKTS